MNILGGAFRVGRLFGIEINVHILFVIWILFRMVYAGAAWQDQLVFLTMLFGIVLLHELGHCFGARSVGGDASNIMMWPLGGLAYAHAPMRPWPQFVTVAAGPFVNVVFCFFSAIAIFVVSSGTVLPGINPLGLDFYMFEGWAANREAVLQVLQGRGFDLLVTFYHVNLFLLAFNLLPIYPLDGGQLFHAIIWPFLGLQRATTIACQVGIVGCIILAILALQGAGGILFFISIFGGFTCWQRLQAAKYGMIVEDPAFTPTYDHREPRGGFFSRIFKTRPRRRTTTTVNPNPGAWEKRQEERQNEEAELDRLLRKVSEHGINSLSYVERQKLERITRERQAREREFQRDSRV